MGISAGPDIITDGLVLELDAGDRNSYPGTGTTWKDLSGNSNNGTLTNGPTFNSGNLGSIVFDGVDDYVGLNGVNSSYFTVSIWVRYTSFFLDFNGHAIISNNTSTSNGFMLYQATSAPYNRAKVFVYTTSLGVLDTNTLLSENTWYNIVCTYDGSMIRMYNNTLLDNSVAQTGTVTSNPGQLLIGKVSYLNSFFAGNIASVQIYNRALSSQEILQNYTAMKTRFGL